MAVEIEVGAAPGAERSHDLDPEGSFLVRGADGAIAGSISCVAWGSRASMGTLCGPDDATRRALVGAAGTYARARGATALVADVERTDVALFASEGFTRVGESARWTRRADVPAPTLPSGSYAIYPVSSAEIMELVAYDTPRFGSGRGRYLATLMAEEPHRAFVAVDRRDGVFSGFAMVDGDQVGPVVADMPEAAAWLLHALATSRAPDNAIVAAWQDPAREAFTAAGYAPTSDVRVRMVRSDGPFAMHPAVLALGRWGIG